ncbi:OmpA family protein [Nitrospira sp. NS4]|uniref:OmpA family protein n=1 Tax=Nitrospira sp. NS4 TaxID=3414498 RepID=UPI003C307B07
MSRRIIHASGIVIMGIVMMVSQGCSLKALQSNGDSIADSKAGSSAGSDVNNWNGEGVNPDFPQNFSGLGQGNSSGELSGFSQNPTEERLTQGGYKASLSPSDVNVRRRAELTKEEKAAIEAGLQDVFYGYDQWQVSDAGMEALNRDASWLKDHPGAVLKIEGHCDERGTTDYNMVLGDKRAKAAQAYLLETGVSPKQVAIVSFGKERPFCFDHAESCYQQNRRGHMLLGTKE